VAAWMAPFGWETLELVLCFTTKLAGIEGGLDGEAESGEKPAKS